MKQVFLGLISLLCLEQIASAQSIEEKILGYQPTQEGVIFHVNSGGCTKPEDFKVDTAVGDSNQVIEVKLIRTRLDTCHSFVATGVKIAVSYEQMGLTPSQAFEVKNENGVVRGWSWKDAENK